MKQLSFTSVERTLLKKLLKSHLIFLEKEIGKFQIDDKQSKKSFNSFYFNPTASALDKITKFETTFYDTKEKSAIISCTNPFYEEIYKKLELQTAISWLTVSEQQKEVINQIDCCKDILSKCGYKDLANSYSGYNPDFRFHNYLDIVEKLKQSKKVFLSGNANNGYYKIAFVYDNKEYFTIHINQELSIRNIISSSFFGKSPDEIGKKEFSIIATKSEAKELFKLVNVLNYPADVLDFINKLLSL